MRKSEKVTHNEKPRELIIDRVRSFALNAYTLAYRSGEGSILAALAVNTLVRVADVGKAHTVRPCDVLSDGVNDAVAASLEVTGAV